ncbi:2-succinyl-5-enolpyruvyl-6-hydroxy-3-cyclohexene-1-carboxylic-acid synthase [Agromyces soli]
MTEAASPASAFAVALLAEFERLGVSDVVVAPGSRSQALALAAAAFEQAGRLRLHVRIDERSAGFLALGLAVETGRPAVVFATSGTAIANLHPAVLEAHHGGVPLIVASADRPAELRGIRSNQTTMQPGIFAGAVRLERDVTAPDGAPDEPGTAASLARAAYAAAIGVDASGEAVPHPGPGPVHLNLQLREPLSSVIALPPVPSPAPHRVGDGGPIRADFGPRSPARSDAAAELVGPAAVERASVLAPGPRTIVVAGAGAGPEAEAVARAGGWPLIAEVTSGARFGPNLVVAYRELLNEPGFGDQVERVVVFGHPTLSREVPAIVQRAGVETVAVAPSGIEWFNPGHRVHRFERAVRVEPQAPNDEQRRWLASWTRASRALLEESAPAEPQAVRSGVDETGHVSDFAAQRAFLDAQLGRVREPVTRRMLVEAVWAASWPHDRLVLGASRLIREADRVVPGRRIHAHANRGLAGIDGTVATAFGIADASQRARAGEGAADASRSPAVASDPDADAASSTPAPAALPAEDAARADAVGPAAFGEHGSLAAILAEAAEIERAVAAAKAEASDPAESSVTRVLVGDLTLLHDAGSLALTPGEPRPRLLVIVGDDGGGTIFDALEVASTAPVDAFDRVQYTPHAVDFAALAAAYGWRHLRATTRGELEEALATRIDGPTLLVVPIAR